RTGRPRALRVGSILAPKRTKAKARTSCAHSVINALDDAQVAIRPITQDSECSLVIGAVVGGNRLGEAVELDQYCALLDATLIRLGGHATSEEAPARGDNRGHSKFGICLSRRRVGDRAIADDPVCLGHGFLRGGYVRSII